MVNRLDKRVVDGGIPVVGHEKRNLSFVPLLEVVETGDTFGFENESGKAIFNTGYVLVEPSEKYRTVGVGLGRGNLGIVVRYTCCPINQAGNGINIIEELVGL